MTHRGITRRHALAAAGALLTAGLARPALAQTTIRQGYQTNIWGMPTYYLMGSGLLEKRGLRSRNSPCRPATSPCSRWWRGRWTSAPMRGPR